MTNISDAYTNCGDFLDAVRAVCGDSGVNCVLEARGSVSVHVPITPKPDHWLSRAIGREMAIKVCQRISLRDAENSLVKYPEFTLPLGFRSKIIKLIQKVEDELLSGQSVALKQAKAQGMFSKVGDPVAVSGAPVICTNFGTPIDETEWKAHVVTHDIIPNVGWSTTVETQAVG